MFTHESESIRGLQFLLSFPNWRTSQDDNWSCEIWPVN